jgi:hypothetical protein
MSTNTEINFQRLLTKCEELAANKKNNDWRYEKVRKINLKSKIDIKILSII